MIAGQTANALRPTRLNQVIQGICLRGKPPRQRVEIHSQASAPHVTENRVDYCDEPRSKRGPHKQFGEVAMKIRTGFSRASLLLRGLAGALVSAGRAAQKPAPAAPVAAADPPTRRASSCSARQLVRFHASCAPSLPICWLLMEDHTSSTPATASHGNWSGPVSNPPTCVTSSSRTTTSTTMRTSAPSSRSTGSRTVRATLLGFHRCRFTGRRRRFLVKIARLSKHQFLQ